MPRTHSSRRIFFAASAVIFVSLLVCPVTFGKIQPPGFPIPARMWALGDAVTPGEYAQLISAIESYWQRTKADELAGGPGLPSSFTHVTAWRIDLGTLGEGFVAYFSHSPVCGATGNCPMALLTRAPKGYQVAILAGGWGDALLPSGGPVPDIAFYWNMSCCESDAVRYHYTKNKFVRVGGATCTEKTNSNPVCAAMQRIPPGILSRGISPAEYDALRPAVEADLEKLPRSFARRYSFEDGHAMTVLRMQEATATAVGLGSCAPNRNCRIWIYARDPKNGSYWPLLSDASAWGVSGLIVARRLSATRDELVQYKAPMWLPRGYGHPELRPGARLVPDACEIVTPKTGKWPAHWDASALVATPVPCFKTTSARKPQIPAADTTNLSAVAQDSTGTIWATGSGFRRHPGSGFWSKDPLLLWSRRGLSTAARRAQLTTRPRTCWICSFGTAPTI